VRKGFRRRLLFTHTASACVQTACPELAGVVAIADQYAGRNLGLINPALYRLEARRAPGIVDITQGNNTVSFSRGGKTITVKGYSAKTGLRPCNRCRNYRRRSLHPRIVSATLNIYTNLKVLL
jgi:hypothetical protein